MATDYDPTLDRELAVIGTIAIDDRVSLEVSIRSYNEGEPKVSVVKFGHRKDGSRYTNPNMGRLSLATTGELVKLLAKVQEWNVREVETPKVIRRLKKDNLQKLNKAMQGAVEKTLSSKPKPPKLARQGGVGGTGTPMCGRDPLH